MTTLFASGDVGGARAVLAVMRAALDQALTAWVLKHGHIASEVPAEWPSVGLQDTTDLSLDRLLAEVKPRVLCFASSVSDPTALRLARKAQQQDVRTIHLLDSWTAYRSRLETDGRPTFEPDVYAVMDELAARGAEAEGIRRQTIRITGQPALANLRREVESVPHVSRSTDRRSILFVSEPAGKDHGTSSASPNFRGYTEATVLNLFTSALQPLADRLDLHLLPHPRDEPGTLEVVWAAARGNLAGELLHSGEGRPYLLSCDGVVGMTSIMLYEAWLLGAPVLSLQPGLRVAALRALKARDGLTFIDSPDGSPAVVRTWAESLPSRSQTTIRPELLQHEAAPGAIVELIQGLSSSVGSL